MSYLNGKLNTTEENLNLLHSEANATDANLDELTDEANQLDQNVKELRQQVFDAKNANIQGEKLDCWAETECFYPTLHIPTVRLRHASQMSLRF